MADVNTLISDIESGKIDNTLKSLYVDESLVAIQKNRYRKALQTYMQYFTNKDVSIYSAPGRTEVGGNHTDHQHGCVLAAAVNLDTLAIVAKRDDDIIHVVSEGFVIKPVHIATLSMMESEIGTSEALIRGICERIKTLGFRIGGLDVYMNSDVLEGAGLSSSASFEVLMGTILSGEYNDSKISSIEIAKIGQYSENNYFGKPCGLMDQMACSVGGFIGIDFKDPKQPIVDKIEFDFATTAHTLCIVDTKGSHADLTPEYAAVPNEMGQIATYFGKHYLREVEEQEFYSSIKQLRNTYSDRSVLRAFHFFNEDERVIEEVRLLKKGDFTRFKEVVKASGDSSYKYLQNVYPSSFVDEQNLSIGLAMSDHILKNEGVSRVHGGGFAGTIQAFVPNNLLDTYKDQMEAIFGSGSCYVLKIRPFGGTKVI